LQPSLFGDRLGIQHFFWGTLVAFFYTGTDLEYRLFSRDRLAAIFLLRDRLTKKDFSGDRLATLFYLGTDFGI